MSTHYFHGQVARKTVESLRHFNSLPLRLWWSTVHTNAMGIVAFIGTFTCLGMPVLLSILRLLAADDVETEKLEVLVQPFVRMIMYGMCFTCANAVLGPAIPLRLIYALPIKRLDFIRQTERLVLFGIPALYATTGFLALWMLQPSQFQPVAIFDFPIILFLCLAYAGVGAFQHTLPDRPFIRLLLGWSTNFPAIISAYFFAPLRFSDLHFWNAVLIGGLSIAAVGAYWRRSRAWRGPMDSKAQAGEAAIASSQFAKYVPQVGGFFGSRHFSRAMLVALFALIPATGVMFIALGFAALESMLQFPFFWTINFCALVGSFIAIASDQSGIRLIRTLPVTTRRVALSLSMVPIWPLLTAAAIAIGLSAISPEVSSAYVACLFTASIVSVSYIHVLMMLSNALEEVLGVILAMIGSLLVFGFPLSMALFLDSGVVWNLFVLSYLLFMATAWLGSGLLMQKIVLKSSSLYKKWAQTQ